MNLKNVSKQGSPYKETSSINESVHTVFGPIKEPVASKKRPKEKYH